VSRPVTRSDVRMPCRPSPGGRLHERFKCPADEGSPAGKESRRVVCPADPALPDRDGL